MKGVTGEVHTDSNVCSLPEREKTMLVEGNVVSIK